MAQQFFVDYLPSERYNKLLEKFCKDEEVMELLEMAVLDKQRAKERYYMLKAEYPDERDGLNKLIYDLIVKKQEMFLNEQAKKKEERENGI